MIEADVPSTGVTVLLEVCPPHWGGRHGLTTRGPAQRFEGAKRRAAPKEREKRGPGRYRSRGFRALARLLRVLLL
jgi:hypothetical protein